MSILDDCVAIKGHTLDIYVGLSVTQGAVLGLGNSYSCNVAGKLPCRIISTRLGDAVGIRGVTLVAANVLFWQGVPSPGGTAGSGRPQHWRGGS